jgi:hypothetical protein
MKNEKRASNSCASSAPTIARTPIRGRFRSASKKLRAELSASASLRQIHRLDPAAKCPNEKHASNSSASSAPTISRTPIRVRFRSARKTPTKLRAAASQRQIQRLYPLTQIGVRTRTLRREMEQRRIQRQPIRLRNPHNRLQLDRPSDCTLATSRQPRI